MKPQSHRVFDPSREELCSPPPGIDPVTGRVGGIAPGYDFSQAAIAHPQVRYEGPEGKAILEADIHLDDKGSAYMLMFCPRCRHAVTIHSANKAFLHRPESMAEVGGEISVDKFECSNDLRPGEACKFRGAIDRNVLKRT